MFYQQSKHLIYCFIVLWSSTFNLVNKLYRLVIYFRFYPILEVEEQDAHFRHILLYYFRKVINASQVHKKLCAVYGNEVLMESRCQNWFAKFRSGDDSLKNSERTGRPVGSWWDSYQGHYRFRSSYHNTWDCWEVQCIA